MSKKSQAIDEALSNVENVERANAKSKQPRFNTAEEAWNYFYAMIERSHEILPPYAADSRKRDGALLRLMRSEPLLSSVVSSAVSRDKNRGWTLTGTARQVALYSNRMYQFNNGDGWRKFVSLNSTSWYTTNLGFSSEIGFAFRNGPGVTMWHFDPTNLRLSGDSNFPLYFYPPTGTIKLRRGEYIHGNSMPAVETRLNGIGFCAVERALEFTRVMIGLNNHNLEKLGVAPPKGILHGTGITRQEWNQAWDAIREDSENIGADVYKDIVTLFTQNERASLNMIALSELPDNFELKSFIDIIMQAYSLAFGYPVGEFWAIESGSFGRTGEMKVQQQQATVKGELDFSLSFQEQLQTNFIPQTMNFQFDQRNDSGELIKLETDKTKAEIILSLYDIDERKGLESLIDKEEARQLLAEQGIMPRDWAKEDKEIETSDLQEMRERAIANPGLLRVMRENPKEPIVSYRYDPLEIYDMERSNDARIALPHYFPSDGKLTILWNKAEDAFARRQY